MKRVFISLIVLSVIFIIGNKLTALEKDLKNLFDNIDNYQLVKCTTGNFTGSKKTEYLCHYSSNTYSEDNPNNGIHIDIFYIYIVENNKILNKFSVDRPYGNYRYEFYKKIVHNKKIKIGKWDGYSYIGDFNSNGFDEIFIFILSGMSFEIEIFEFNGKNIEEKLKPPTFDLCNIISRVETESKDGKNYIKVWGEKIDKKNNTIDWYKYGWNPKTGYYEIVDKGFEKLKFKCNTAIDCMEKMNP